MCFPSVRSSTLTSTGRKMKFAALLLVGAAALANAGPVVRDTCATVCDITQTKFLLAPGTTYLYDYEGETVTKVEGASEEISGLHVRTTAKINVISPCEMQLELRGTELSHLKPTDATAKDPSPVGGAFKEALEANAIRFGMNNGRVERVCGGVADAAWVLNVKKAIISALQNNMADLKRETTIRETDVVGTCDTVYKTMADGSIMKTKNLLGCIDREYLNTMIQHAHYMVPSDVQGVPFLKSEHACKQTIANGIVTKVECTESHIARPFSNGEAGAATMLKMTMTLKRTVPEVIPPKPIAFTTPITFDMTKTEKELKDAADFVKTAIAEICTAGHAEDKSPERFAKLLKNVQALDAPTLLKIHQEIRAAKVCRLGEKTFHDVLPLAGTTAAVSLMKDILLSNEISGVEKEMWKSALAFIPHPTKEMIAHVTPLLAIPDRKIYLSTSTLVRNFCANTPDCHTVKEVADFVKVLEAHVGTDCGGDTDVVLMSLKAIGNVGKMLTVAPLVTCAKNDKIPMDLRIASLEAFRNMKLEKPVKMALIGIYKDMELDPELRIGAFVALMRDPCQMCIDAVQATMAKERMLQVGSFVMSYMVNARKADNPAKREINAILKKFDETKIKRDWNLERMKYSRAYEASYFSSYLNAGIDAESHVVFSPAGFLPRQVKTDLNVNLFGRSINLLEVGARMEGLENLLEYYFGPTGTLADTGVARTKRAALNTKGIDEIHEQVKSVNVLKEARGLMYLKMFGSELGYTEFNYESLMKEKDNINVLELLKSIARNHEAEYTQNFQLMDMTYTIPTVMGLPLKLDLNAHGTVHLKVGGKLDLLKFMKPPRDLDIDGHIKPSAAIEIKTEMGIDAFLTQTGIKMVANVHTATAFEGKILLKGGKIFKVEYAVPKTEQEIFHGMTEFFVKHHVEERKQRMITKDAISLSQCTGDMLASITGLEMCGNMRLPNAVTEKTAPFFPFTGPVDVRLAIKNRDPKLTKYVFEASKTSAEGVEQMKLMFNTPGSTVNRELSTVVTLNTVTQSLDFDMKSPWKSVHAAASLVNNPGLKKVTAKVVIDKVKEYSATATVLLEKVGDQIKIIPEFNVNANGVEPMKVGGQIVLFKNAKIVADLKVEKLTATPITFVCTLERVFLENQLRINHDLAIVSPLVTLASKGFVEKKAVKFIVRSENSFKFREGKEHKMVFNTKIHSEKRRDVHIFNVQTNLALSDYPEHAMGFAVDFKKTAISTKFDVKATFKKATAPIQFLNEWTHKLSKPMNVVLKSELILPSLKMGMEHKFVEGEPGNYKISSLSTWGPGKEIKAEFDIVDKSGKEEFIRAEVKGFLEAPSVPKTVIVFSPIMTKRELVIFAEMKYSAHVHILDIRINRESNTVNALCHVTLDGLKHELNLKIRTLPNLIEMAAEAKLHEKVYAINLSAALEKTALKLHADVSAMGKKVEFNVIGEMTGQTIKGHIDASMAEKKIEANIDYLRNGLNLKVIVSAKGLEHLNAKIGSLAFKLHNEITGKDLTTLIETKIDEKALLVVALKGARGADQITLNAKIAALTVTVAGDLTLAFKSGAYSAMGSLALPTRTVGLEASFAGAKGNGLAKLNINLNKKEEGNFFEYGLKWSRAAPKDRAQFNGELTMKCPTWLFPLPVKMTALLSKDIRGTYKADLVIDYGLKFELKAIHKMMPIGIETNVEINTPMEEFEKMSAELVATVVENNLTFKLAALKDKKAIEVKLTGKVATTPNGHHAEVDFLLKTPFKNVEMITAAINHELTGMDVKSSAEIKWGINKKVAVIFDHKANDLMNISGKLIVITPIRNFETTTLVYTATTTGPETNAMVKFVLAGKVCELNAQFIRAQVGFKLMALLKTPAVEDIKLNIDFGYKPMRLFETNVEVAVGKAIVALKTKAERSDTKIEAKLTWITPRVPEGITAKFEFNNPNGGKNLDATLTLTLDAKRSINLVAYMKKENWLRTEGKLELTSFLTPKITADFGWHITIPIGILKTNFALEYVPGKKITAELDMNLNKPDLEFTLKATTPFQPLKLLRYYIKSTGDLKNLNTHVERQLNDMLISTDIEAKLISFNDFELKVTTTSPIRTYEKTSYTISNKGPLSDMLTKATLSLNGKEWAVEGITRLVDVKDMFFGLTVTTPLKNLEKIGMEMSHKGSLDNMVTKVTVITPKILKNPVVIELATKFVKITDMQVKLTLKGLDALEVEPLTIAVSNRGEALNPLLTIISVTYGPKVYTLTNTLKFQGITNMEGSLVLTTPIPKYERVGLTWANKMVEGKKEAKLIIEFQTEQRITIDGHIVKKGATLETRLTILTPFAAFDKADFALDFTGTLNDFEGIVTLSLPKLRTMEIHFGNVLDLTAGIVHKASFRIDCIFFSTTSIETNFEMKGPAVKFEAKFGYGLKKGTYVLNAKQIKAENTVTFELDTALNTDWTEAKSAATTLVITTGPNPWVVKVVETLRFNGAELLTLSFEHKPTPLGFNCALLLKQGIFTKLPKAFDLKSEIELSLPKSMIKLATAVDATPFISVDYMHTYEAATLTSKVVLGYKDGKAETNILISKPQDTLLVSVDALRNTKKIGNAVAELKLTAEKTFLLKVKAVLEGKTLVDINLRIKPDLTSAAIELSSRGSNIFGVRGGLRGHLLEAHLVVQDTPIMDVIAEFKTEPITVVLQIKYKGTKLIDTKTVIDTKARKFTAMLDIDNLIAPLSRSSWVLTLNGNVERRRDMTVFVSELSLAAKTIRFEIARKASGKIDLTLRPATLVFDLKASTKNLPTDLDVNVVLNIKKNSGLVVTSLECTTLFDKRQEALRVNLEYKQVRNLMTTSATLFFSPLKIASGLNTKFERTDALTYEIALTTDLAKAKETTTTISGKLAIKNPGLVFEIKAALPTRTVTFEINHEWKASTLKHAVAFSWETGKSTGYSFTLIDRSKETSMVYQLDGEFTHPIRTVKYNAKIEKSPRKYLFDLNVLPDATKTERKTFFKVDITNESYGEMLQIKAITTFGHPSLEKPLAMTVSFTLNRGKILLATTVDIDYSKFDRKRISTSFRLVNDARDADSCKYSLVADVKQPANFVDVRATSAFEKTAAGMIHLATKFSYFTSQRELKEIDVKIDADVPAKKAAARVTTPSADRKVEVLLIESVTAEGRQARLVLTHEDILRKEVKTLVDVELDEKSRVLRIAVSDLLKVEANVHQKYMVHLTVIAKGKQILLFKTSFKDATHMLINTKLQWDPVVVETIKTEVPKAVARVAGYVAAVWEPIVKEILADLQTKIAAIEEIGMKDLRPIFEAWRKFVRALEKDMASATKAVKQMIRANEFYLKDATAAMATAWEKFMVSYKEMEGKFWLLHKDMMTNLEQNHKELMNFLRSLESHVKTALVQLKEELAILKVKIEAKFQEIKPRIEALVRANLEKAEQMIQDFIREYKPKMKEFVTNALKAVGDFRAKVLIPLHARITAWVADLEKQLEPLKEQLAALWVKFLARLEEIKKTGLATSLIELQAQLEAKYATTAAAVVEWLNELNAKFEAIVKEWESYPQVKELKKTLDMFKAKLVWAWNYLDVPAEFAKLVKDLKMRRDRFIRIIKDNKSGLVVWDAAKGIFEFDIEIPIALKELAVLPTFDAVIDRISNIKREIVAALPKLSWTPMDYYYYYKPRSTNIRDLVPPFTATGIVAGNQHYFTFDGSFFEFAGGCSYVLARDFTDGKFTVIANYRSGRRNGPSAGPKRNSITVMSGGKTIEIFNTFKTVVDKQNSELPIETTDAVVKRAGPDQIVIESKKGMTVACHMKTEVCTVSISGWYFGKTGGLLGTYDYEPMNDMSNPKGKNVEDVENFANTWEVAKTCSDNSNHAKAFHKVANIQSTAAYSTCSALFMADSSPLRPAFRVVDPTPFMSVCVNDVFEWQRHADAEKWMLKKTCAAVSAYMTEAKNRGIMLKAPAHCMSCENVDGTDMAVGESEKVINPTMGVDTVIVFEENICNKNRRKDLLGLISNLQNSYKNQGLKNNLFGLTAFGGPGVHKDAHFHTIEGELMNTDRKFVRGVRSLEFADEKPTNFVEGAIAFAAKNYPWRTGIKKNVVVVSCSACETSKPSTDLRTILSETHVHLHMLRDLEFSYRGGKRASNVLGFDRSGVFITKDTTSRTLNGNAALLNQLSVPKESCIPALMDNDGTFFTTNSFTTGRIREQKKFLDVFSRRVAATSTPASCQICECRVTCPFTMKTSTVCKPCN
jgi:hypothetical protein